MKDYNQKESSSLDNRLLGNLMGFSDIFFAD
jgi:hypothetical protein